MMYEEWSCVGGAVLTRPLKGETAAISMDGDDKSGPAYDESVHHRFLIDDLNPRWVVGICNW